MPRRETVAGEALSRSAHSRRKRRFLPSVSRSLEGRQSTLWSSSTVFSESAHAQSTHPSKTIPCSAAAGAAAARRMAAVAVPSPHSWLEGRYAPKSSASVRLPGSITVRCTPASAASAA